MLNEAGLRIGIFLTVLVVMMIWEASRPNRTPVVVNSKRWRTNFFLVLCGALVGRLIAPAGLAVVALFAGSHNIGLLLLLQGPMLAVPDWAIIVLGVLLLDCLIYWQHRLFHRVPLLWRLHRVHHADPHLDASTGLRFHPFEIALSLLVKATAILLLGVPVEAILIFEIVLNASSIFNHSNIKLPNYLEWPLRKLIVTQAMHRIHHSQVPAETNSNFGFSLSFWDRMFSSYCKNASAGDAGLTLGLKEYGKEQNNTGILTVLLMPFRKTPQG
jgi:sterol desaturase/sphingolipid hydroxylase (fatty acid hydroxylase superfamily)